jgi:hypothetical protein
VWIFKKINKVFFKNLDNLFSKYWLNYFKSSKYIFRIAFSIRPIGFQITSNCWNSFFRIAFSIRPIGFHSLDEVIKKLLSVQAWCYQAWCYYLWLSLEVSRDSSVVASSTTQTCQQEDVGSNLGMSGGGFPRRHELNHIVSAGKFFLSCTTTHQKKIFFYILFVLRLHQ